MELGSRRGAGEGGEVGLAGGAAIEDYFGGEVGDEQPKHGGYEGEGGVGGFNIIAKVSEMGVDDDVTSA